MTRPPPPPVPAPSSGGRRGNWILVFVLKHITCPYYLLYTPSVPLINQLLCVCVQVSDLVIILNQRRAVEAFTMGGNLTLGGNCTVAVGPMGR